MKNKITVDIHTHTIASGHAYGTVRENALAAKEAGLTGLGISEHAPGIPGTCDPMVFRNMPHSIPRELYGVNIYFGVENNLLNDGTMTLTPKQMDRLDYCIVGIHGFCYEDEGMEKNTDNLIKAMADPRTFFISHPDDGTWPLDYERLVKAAKELGVALELNNSHIVNPWRKNSLENMHTYLRLCMEHKTNIFIGSDAHDPSRVGHFEKAEAMLEEMGFDEDLIINNSEDRFREFIRYNKK